MRRSYVLFTGVPLPVIKIMIAACRDIDPKAGFSVPNPSWPLIFQEGSVLLTQEPNRFDGMRYLPRHTD
jgi:hypothetical protein